MLLRFCPACGNKLPQTDSPNFCPSCGENLAKLKGPEASPAVPAAAASATSAADIARRYDQFVLELREQGLPEAEVRRQAAEMFAQLKAELPSRVESPGRRPDEVKIHYSLPEETPHSVVLKTCGNRERLTKRLSEVLRRGMLATRMAVDMTPSVIVYKGKADDVHKVTAILDEENLFYTVIEGDFSTDAALEIRIPGFTNLDEPVQSLLKKVPAALWYGETIRLAVPGVELAGEPGTLVAGDSALYFFNDPVGERQPEWRIVPYSHLEEVNLEDNQEGILELIYQQYGLEEQLVIDDEVKSASVYEIVRHALEQGTGRRGG